MNFKLTLWKVILSVLFGVLANYIEVKIFIMKLCACGPEAINCTCSPITWAEKAFEPEVIISSLIGVVLVYVIWSLIQKK